MYHPINDQPVRPTARRAGIALLLAAALSGSPLSAPARALPLSGEAMIHIAVSRGELGDPRSLARVRRQIAIAANELCGSGGLTAVYRNGARRCREQVVADAERQLQRRLGARFGEGGAAAAFTR